MKILVTGGAGFIGSNFVYYMLKKYTKKREVYELAKEIMIDVGNEDDIDVFIEKNINQMEKIVLQTEKDLTFSEQINETLKKIETRVASKDKDKSLFTGIFELDRLTDGLHGSELTVIGARPGVGKTTFALQVSENILRKGKSVAFISLEMSEEQIITKLISRLARVSASKIRNGNLDDSEIMKIAQASGRINDYNFSILTKCRTIQQIEIAAKKLKSKNKLDLLVIDYLQLVKNSGNFTNREQQVADISRTLKLLSLDLEIPIIALCQLNRNAAKAVPTLADIRESGSIEQDADNIIFLYAESEESNIVNVDLQKQRAGNTGVLKIKFNKMNSEFVNFVWKDNLWMKKNYYN